MNVTNAPQPLRHIRQIFSHRPLYRKASRPGIIAGPQVLAQLRADLTGKDSHRGVTLSYTWLANQFGHFSLGFIPTILLVYFFSSGQQSEPTAIWAALRVSLFWTLFEILNFLGPLSTGRSRKRFAPAWKNIAFDTATDILFFCLGASVAAALRTSAPEPVIVAMALGFLLMPMSYHWYLTKMYQQRAGFPKQLRLGQWKGNLCPSDYDTVMRFSTGDAGRHLFISGDDAALSSDLGIALANEQAIAHRSCRYLSAMKLAAFLGQSISKRARERAMQDAATLVVDDFNTGGAAEHEAALIKRLLHEHPAGALNRSFLQSRNMIWILAGVPESRLQNWIAVLMSAGVRRESISVVHALAARGSGQDVIVVSEGYQMRQAFDIEAFV